MDKIKEKLKSVRFKLFLVMCIVIIFIILCLILVNSVVLETFYMYSKTNTVRAVYARINEYYSSNSANIDLDEELKNIAFKNNFDILIQADNNIIVFSTNRDFISSIDQLMDNESASSQDQTNIIYKDRDIIIRKVVSSNSSMNYILLSGNLVNDYKLYIRIPIAPIEESVRISNNVLIFIGCITIIISGIIASVISKKFTDPILELNSITNKMARLDFSQKYVTKDVDDEINDLGKNINTMSNKLETIIKQLRDNNIELEKDIEEKSKIDEMRKQFISDVSHELKTPIALIQGYSEGLLENVNSDPESRKFYAEVILDETNKMDKMVRQLIELTKLEYEKREFNNRDFNIVELEKEIVRTSQVMLVDKGTQVEFETEDSIDVFADDMFISQIITNYLTNAIKHVKDIDGDKYIKITNKIIPDKNKVRVTVFNTGDNISKENLSRIWNRFFKADEARNRDDGGSGIGLSIVRAIMNNYGNDYGVENKYNGVEFFFEVDRK